MNELQNIAARARLLELALMGAERSGMSIDGGPYLEALAQGARDVASGLERMAQGSPAKAVGEPFGPGR